MIYIYKPFFNIKGRSLSIGSFWFAFYAEEKQTSSFLSRCLGEGNQTAAIYLCLCCGGKASFVPSTSTSSILQKSSKIICFLQSKNSSGKRSQEWLQYFLQNNICSMYSQLQLRTTATNCNLKQGKKQASCSQHLTDSGQKSREEALAAAPLRPFSQGSWRKSV